MTNQIVSMAIIFGVVIVASVVFAVRSERFRQAAVGVGGAALAGLIAAIAALFIRGEAKKGAALRRAQRTIKEGRKEAEEDRAVTEAAISAEVKKEVEIHEEAKDEQEELAKPKKTRTRLKA